MPWRSSLVQKSQLPSGTDREGVAPGIRANQPHRHAASSDDSGGNHGNPGTTQLVSPLTQMGVASKKRSKHTSILLRPVRPISGGGPLNKKISMSVDTHLDTRGGGGSHDLRGSHDRSHDLPRVGRLGGHGGHNHGNNKHHQQLLNWASNARVGSLPRRSRDIQGMMEARQPVTSPYSSVQDISLVGGLDGGGRGSVTSVDIKTELFSGAAGEAWGHDGMGVSPNGSRVGSAYGNRRVSPHGSTGVSPYGSTTVSPYGSRTVSPHGSRAMSPHVMSDGLEGSKVDSPSHSRVLGRPRENGGEFPKPKRRHHHHHHHHRSVSANPAIKGQGSDYYAHAVNGFDHPGIQNGAHHHQDHPPPPPHHILHMSDELSEVKRSSSGKTGSHTHPSGRGHSADKNSYLTEL